MIIPGKNPMASTSPRSDSKTMAENPPPYSEGTDKQVAARPKNHAELQLVSPNSIVARTQAANVSPNPPTPNNPTELQTTSAIVSPNLNLLTPSVSQVHVLCTTDDITGTFHIDANAHGDGPPIRTRYGIQKKKKKSKGKNVKVEGPHASFQTGSGKIKLQLDTVSSSTAETDRANIFIGSKTGKIEITLMPRAVTTSEGMTIHQPFMGVDVFSRSGDVIVYVPETFSGIIRVESAKGEMRFLPVLESGMRVLKSTQRETTATLGDGQGNLVEVFTQTGRIVVGIAGQDEYKEEVGFWRRLFLSN